MDDSHVSVKIGVGYMWAGGSLQADARWGALRSFLSTATREAISRADKVLSRGGVEVDEVEDESEVSSNSEESPSRLRVSIARLRATPGMMTWESVKQHIDESDVVLFDLTPNGEARVSPNIWLELGYALARPERKVLVVHASLTGYEELPSDLKGMLVGHVPSDGKASDIALRMAIVNHVKSLLVARAGTS